MNYSGKRLVKIIKKIKKLNGSDYFDAMDRLEISLARIMVLENKERLFNLFHSLYVECTPLEDIPFSLTAIFDAYKDRWNDEYYNFYAGHILGQKVSRIEDLPKNIEIDENIHKEVLLNELRKFCKLMYNKTASNSAGLFMC